MLTLRCTLLRQVFEGGAPDDPRTAEWPPSWMRLFSALVSVAEPEGADDDLLRRLESAALPEIHATPVHRSRRQAFVPTNKIQDETTHTNLPARTNGERIWARAIPRSPEVWYRWAELTLSDKESQRLRRLCRRVPYFGRSTSPAVVEVVGSDAPTGGWLEPLDDPTDAPRFALAATVRSPFPGALDALRAAYDEKFRLGETGDPWEIGLGIEYGRIEARPSATVFQGPYTTMVALRLEGRRLDGRHTARVAHAVRRAVLSRAADHIAPLHGHHDGDIVQIAFLGLVHVGHPQADGHLLGIGLALPELTPEHLRIVADALPATDETMPVTAGPLGALKLHRISPLDATTAHGLQPDRWSSASRRWASVTPVVLDRFTGRHGDLADEIQRAALNAHLPEPAAIAVSRRSVIAGAPGFTPSDTLRRPGDRVIPYCHVVLQFREPVQGPIVLGSMRHYGLGHCVPLTDEEADGG
ncbi:MAG: type I-G CRISPR-associated protein Csb2 [Actinomycetota bacterium]